MCYSPVNLKKTTAKQFVKDTYFTQQVPCGKCVECRKARVNSWFVRLKDEVGRYPCKFITLTYDDVNLPYSENGLMSLHIRDVQLFFKRLRKLQSDKIKYFAVGEYGGQTNRPHYHIILFNVKDFDNVSRCWDKGFVHYGDVTDKSIYYTLKYSVKNLFDFNGDVDDDRVKSKAFMSKGLGLGYLSDNIRRYYADDVSRPVTLLGNRKLALPRYYRDKLFDDGQKIKRNILLSDVVKQKAERFSDKKFPSYVREIIRRSKSSLIDKL